ncbi:MAG: hypothetical protein HZB95_01800 [Nitrosomonadales bacterium]|nr:hypothetical protein [Nitrosomonadales bacterium]
MSIFEIISNNQLISSLFAATIISTIGYCWTSFRNYRDSNRIYEFLSQSASDTNFVFRSTQAISARTKITENRIEELCSKHLNIRRNEKEKQSWQIIEQPYSSRIIVRKLLLQRVLPATLIAMFALTILTKLLTLGNQQIILPADELAKLSEEAYIENEWLFIKLYNGSTWTVQSITVEISRGKNGSPHNLERIYRLNCNSSPLTATECKTNAGFSLGKDERLFGKKISAEGQPG